MNYVIEEIKKKDKFKNIDFKNREDENIIRAYLKIKKETENIKIKLSLDNIITYKISDINGNDNFKLEITRKNVKNYVWLS